MTVYTDVVAEPRLLPQLDPGQTRVREGTPLQYDESAHGVRPLNPSHNGVIDAVALRRGTHDGTDVLTEVVCETTDDGERTISEYTDGTFRQTTTVYGIDETVPIRRVTTGDVAFLRSITEECEAYTGDGSPSFDGAVSLVEDVGAIDGIRVAPTDAIDARYASLSVGTVAETIDSPTVGFSTPIPVEIERF